MTQAFLPHAPRARAAGSSSSARSQARARSRSSARTQRRSTRSRRSPTRCGWSLRPFGIDVSIVQPGSIKTPIWTKSAQRCRRAGERRGGRAQSVRRAGRRVPRRRAEARREGRGPPTTFAAGRRGGAHDGAPADAASSWAATRSCARASSGFPTGSATGCTNACCCAKRRNDGRPDDGLPADAPDPAAARGDVLRRQGDRHAPARQVASTATRTRHGAPREAACSRARTSLGLERGDRVATLCWNHYQHLEAYFGIPCGGFVLHTLNLRLHPNDIGYIASHAGDRALIVDASLLPLARPVPRPDADRARLRRRGLLRGAARLGATRTSGATPSWTRTRRRRCVTRAARPACRRASSTRTARRSCTRSASQPPTRSGSALRGRTRSFRSSRCSMRTPGAIRTSPRWSGAKLVFPGPHLDAESLLERLRRGRRHVDGGRADDLARDPAAARREPRTVGPLAHEGHARRRLGGAAGDDRGLQGAPRPHGLPRVGDDRDLAGGVDGALPGDLATGDDETQFDYIAMQGSRCRSSSCARGRRADEISARRRDDGRARGARARGSRPPTTKRRSSAGSLDGGRLVQDGRHRLDRPAWVHPDQDRSKDVIKSGGEWISLGRPRERADGASRGR